MPEEWGEAIHRIRFEDDELRRGLIASERLAERSATKMQSSLDKVTMSTEKTGEAAYSTGQVFGAFGAQMSAVGGVAGTVGGKIASLGGAVSSLGKAMFGLPGLILAVTAAGGAFIAWLVQARDRAEQATKALEAHRTELVKQREEFTKAAGAIERKTQEQLMALARPEEAVRIGLRLRLEDLTPQVEAARAELARIRRDMKSAERMAAGPATAWRAEAEMRLAALRQEEQQHSRHVANLEMQRIAAVEDAERKIQVIRDAARKEEIARQKQAAQEAAATWTTAFTRWQQTAVGRVSTVLSSIIQEERMRRQIEAVLQGPLFQGLFRIFPNLEEVMRQRLAPSLGTIMQTQVRPMAGGIERAALAGGPVPIAAAFSPADRRDEQRTKDVAAIKDALQPGGWLARLLDKIGGGTR